MVDGKVSLAGFEADIAKFLLKLLPEVTNQGVATACNI